ncbi:MAG TPA: hypothetical protein PKL97_00810 [Candidatus Omnitrophota bacterium]|nr:hypothetical protein [Candidatus Omnitrophota bacterium]
MILRDRIFLAIGILLIDLCVFFIPLIAVLLAYILIARPVWFRDWTTRLYAD